MTLLHYKMRYYAAGSETKMATSVVIDWCNCLRPRKTKMSTVLVNCLTCPPTRTRWLLLIKTVHRNCPPRPAEETGKQYGTPLRPSVQRTQTCAAVAVQSEQNRSGRAWIQIVITISFYKIEKRMWWFDRVYVCIDSVKSCIVNRVVCDLSVPLGLEIGSCSAAQRLKGLGPKEENDLRIGVEWSRNSVALSARKYFLVLQET